MHLVILSVSEESHRCPNSIRLFADREILRRPAPQNDKFINPNYYPEKRKLLWTNMLFLFP